MKIKSCEICGCRFTFQNKSKKTCSDRCRKRLSRKKKKELISVGSVVPMCDEETKLTQFVNSDIKEIILILMMKRILVFCEEKCVHVSEIELLDRMLDSLNLNSEKLVKFKSLSIILHKIIAIKDQSDQVGYVHFETKKVKKHIADLKRLAS